MSKEGAAVMRAQARNLRGLRQRMLSTLPSDYNVEMLAYEAGVIAEALEHAAKEELEAGKRWWKEQEAKRESQMIREMAAVQREIEIAKLGISEKDLGEPQSLTRPKKEPWL